MRVECVSPKSERPQCVCCVFCETEGEEEKPLLSQSRSPSAHVDRSGAFVNASSACCGELFHHEQLG